MEIKVFTKKWGSSLGIILPKKVVENQRISEHEEILIDIKGRQSAKTLFGKFPRASRKSAQDLKDEMKRGG